MSAVSQKPSTLSPFRYPGGKSALRTKVINWIRNLDYRVKHFVEPFAGGSSVGLAVAELDLADHVTLVERDPDVAAVWNVVLNGSVDKFATRIRGFVLTHESARGTLDGKEPDLVSRAFRCLLLNRISRGGVMAPGAGWLNYGEAGKGIHSRWYPETIAKRIETIHSLRAKLTFIRGDGLETLKNFSSTPHTVAFVDPPYVVNGRGAGIRLYRYHNVDCEKLFEIVRNFSGPMIVTYHRSQVVQREARTAGAECHTVVIRTSHSVKRELIFYKPGSKEQFSHRKHRYGRTERNPLSRRRRVWGGVAGI
jgi:DNA adenine methylase